jgi:5'-3' exonuclease
MKLLKSCTFASSLFTEIAGRRVGVDTSIMIYEYGRAYAPEAMAPVPRYSCIIDAVLHASNVCRKAGATLVFVADNRKVDARAKSCENGKRRAAAAAAYSAWMANPQDTKLLRRAFKVSDELQEAVLTALRADNFDVVQAPLEADSQLALMFREGLIFSVMSSDTDFIAYGVTRLITRWNGYCQSSQTAPKGTCR